MIITSIYYYLNIIKMIIKTYVSLKAVYKLKIIYTKYFIFIITLKYSL